MQLHAPHSRYRRRFVAVLLATALWPTLLGLAACAGPSAGAPTAARPAWALALHGGAGVISPDLPEAVRDGYMESLQRALDHGRDRLAAGTAALDVVEEVVRMLEGDPRFNAGQGAVYTADGTHELDASIMNGENLACGAVTGVRTVRHPITLARRVMERSRHVFFAADGAEAFADSQPGIERVANDFFDTDHRREALERALGRTPEPERGTVGCVALDTAGHLAAATSTGGMTAKQFGRIGDSPVVGAGTYADDRTCAVSCTGSGEEFIRHCVAHAISARMEHLGETVTAAAEAVVHGTLAEGDGGVIAVSHTGEIGLVFNSPGMFRAAANANGHREVAIWR